MSSLLLRDATISRAGEYTVSATDGEKTRSVKWTVYRTAGKRAAKNVILFVGDGLSGARKRSHARSAAKPAQASGFSQNSGHTIQCVLPAQQSVTATNAPAAAQRCSSR